ncbi:hypothetical protein VB264_18680 [Arcicella aquatica]|uniref:Uncharacterized protein n=1 Tax=Arcicella aquatica TaxID=217141 RepID=A0ABU5QRV8_9BACT|nr:hypothetical protein [Arcicella aquatica]MEA5259830.1 hypothetical protein [Arcicella aquatica]
MKKILTFFTIMVVLSTLKSSAQSTLKEYKAGHVFYISLPSYMTKTMGLNESSIIQYKNAVKDVYGFVIEDNKEDLAIAELNYGSLEEFYDYFMSVFLKEAKKKTIGKPIYTTKGETRFAEVEITYYDEDIKAEIYYLAGIVETKTSYYKIISWCAGENKDKYKTDFQKIIYSIRD